MDPERIKRNKKAFYDAKNKRQAAANPDSTSNTDRKPLRITGRRGKFQGKPLILNKKGAYVLDSAEMHCRQEKEDLKVLCEATEKLVAKYKTSDKPGDTLTPPPKTDANANSEVNMAAIRAAISCTKGTGGSR